MKSCIRWAFIINSILGFAATSHSQSLGNAGTVGGSVVDPSGAAIVKAAITIHNPVTGCSQSIVSGADGAFQLNDIPPNQYHLEIKASGFSVFSQDVTIRNSLPIQVKATLTVAAANTTVNVEGGAAEALETDPSGDVSADRIILSKLPMMDPGAGLGQAIIYSTGGVRPCPSYLRDRWAAY